VNNLLIHPITKTQLEQFLSQPNHALLLYGSGGSGKTHLARNIAEQLLQLRPGTIEHYPYFLLLTPEKGSISIENVRELQHHVRLKTTGKAIVRRIIVIEHADSMTIEAQNAYLKLLEEPPADTVMILTANSQQTLLPTIRSRLQAIAVRAPSEAAVRAFFAQAGNYSPVAIDQAYFLSGGLPGLMTALLSEDETHPLLASVAAAKQILSSRTVERLALVDDLSKRKEEARYTLDALIRIAQTGLEQATKKADTTRLRQWQRILKLTTQATDALDHSANSKLVFTSLFLHI
jgi:DNA polymerase-3 subunit delta'